VKKSFLYPAPVLWPVAVDFLYGVALYGSQVLNRFLLQPPLDPSNLSPIEIFDSYFWHPFVIFSLS